MLFSALETTATLLTSKESFTEPEDELVLLNKDQAKEDLKWDLLEVLNTTLDSDVMQDFLDTNENYLQEILAYRQLYWWYVANDVGEGSRNRELMRTYDKKYREMISKLYNMKSYEIPRSNMVTISR